jgi:uncharacterized protein YjgD (DUF1641 family)
MAFQKKTKEQWEAEGKEKALQKAVDNIESIKQIVKAANIGGESKSDALLMVLLSEVMNLNNHLHWIQIALKKANQGGYQAAAPVEDNMPKW